MPSSRATSYRVNFPHFHRQTQIKQIKCPRLILALANVLLKQVANLIVSLKVCLPELCCVVLDLQTTIQIMHWKSPTPLLSSILLQIQSRTGRFPRFFVIYVISKLLSLELELVNDNFMTRS